jgi:hypothetical protein
MENTMATLDKASPEVGEIISRDTLVKMNKNELVQFARHSYDLNLNAEQTHKEELIDFIMSAARKFKGNAEMKYVRMNAPIDVPEGYVKVRVSPGDHNPNNRPVVVGLNFVMASVPVNMDVVMHGKWLTCLKDAVERKYFVSRQDNGRETLDYNDQHKHPYSILVDNR